MIPHTYSRPYSTLSDSEFRSLRRALRREWKRYKPHLQKSTSLPALQLMPWNRPNFTCLRCGFTNTYIPLCLWCAWSSEEATKRWELETPRPRRLSAPTRASWQLERPSDRRSSIDTLESVSAVWLPLKSLNAITVAVTACVTRSENDSPRSASRHREEHVGASLPGDHRPAVAASEKDLNSVAVADCNGPLGTQTALRKSPSFPFVRSLDHDPADEEVHSISCDVFSSATPEPERTPSQEHWNSTCMSPSNAVELKTPPRNLSNSFNSPLVIDLTSSPMTQSLRHQSSRISLSGASPVPQRTLRHKKRVNLRKKSSCSLRSRFLPPDTPTSQPASSPVRLGHPSRPYYSAIRKNMSRPSSLMIVNSSVRTSPCSTAALTTPSPTFSPAPVMSLASDSGAEFDADDNDDEFLLPSALHTTLAVSPMRTGFSLSGETELRMSLAMSRPDVAGLDYRFRETRGRSSVDVGNKKGTVTGKVKKLGKGIKELMRACTCE